MPVRSLGIATSTVPTRVSRLRGRQHRHPTDLHAAETATIDALLRAGDPHTALTHAIDGSHWERALDIVDEHWTALYTGGFLDTLGAALVERIPAEIADTHPAIKAIRRLHRQFSAPRDVPVVTAEPDVAVGIGPEPAEVVMRAMMLRLDGQFLEAAKVCDAASRHPLPVFDELDEHIRHAYAFYYLHVGITYLLVDRANHATAMFRRAHVAGAGTFVERDAAGKLALTCALEGTMIDGRSWIDEERRHPPLPGDSEKLVRTAGCVAAALVALDEFEPDTALDILTELGTPTDNEEFWAHVLYTRGRHALLTGMPTDGLRFIESHLQRYSTLRTDGFSATLIKPVLADLHLACGNFDQAEDLIASPTAWNHPMQGLDPVPTWSRDHSTNLRSGPGSEACLVVHARLATGALLALRARSASSDRRHSVSAPAPGHSCCTGRIECGFVSASSAPCVHESSVRRKPYCTFRREVTEHTRSFVLQIGAPHAGWARSNSWRRGAQRTERRCQALGDVVQILYARVAQRGGERSVEEDGMSGR